VPHFVKCLGEVKEGRRAQCAVLKAFHNLIDYSMRLLYRGMDRSKAKLVTGNEVGKVHVGLESLQEEFLKDLRRNREEANWAIESDYQQITHHSQYWAL